MDKAARPGASLAIDDPNAGQIAIDLASYIMHAHYCRNDIDAVTETFDDENNCFSWFGAGEEEHAVGSDVVTDIFLQFKGKVPPCEISDEHYDVISPAPGVFLVSGMMWIATKPETGISIRVHQRLTACFRIKNDALHCCHIHISNPYSEMQEGDVGFPTQMAKHTYDYLQERINEQKQRISDQTAELAEVYSTVPCAIIRLRRTGNVYTLVMINPYASELIGCSLEEVYQMDWSKGFCERFVPEDAELATELLSGLKTPGDKIEMICRMSRTNDELVYVSSINELMGSTDEYDIVQKIAFDVTERIVLEQALERQSFEDSLTGLYNRNKFNQEMRDAHYNMVERLGVAHFDVNGLKQVNDTLGHRAGDDLIARSARHIKRYFSDKGYRIGGDEFVIIDTETNRDEFERKIAQVCRDMADDNISIAMGQSFRYAGCNLEEQFEHADKRMYNAKAKHYQERANDRRKR